MAKLSVLAATLAASAAAVNPEAAFEEFVAKYGRSYASAAERSRSFDIFAANLAHIEAENAKGHSYTLGVNEFADLSPEEFRAHHFGMSGSLKESFGSMPYLGRHEWTGGVLEESVDWTKKGAVTPPKNQGHCGSCWSFSSTGALEGAWKIATGKLVSLSEQQLVDCSKNGNQGCSGGSMDLAFTYLEDQNVCTEESYPYTAQDGTCHSECTTGIPKGGVTGYKDVSAEDTEALMSAVAQQPVSVAIEADQQVFQFYHGGVIKDGCGSKLDHGVLIVGYGVDDGVEYWKVKNSWGPSWGEEGYVRIKRGLPQGGECGIKDNPSYPVVAKEAPSPVEKAFDDFVARYDRMYDSPEERAKRFDIFRANFEHIDEVNSKGYTYKLAINEFADLSAEEFKAGHFGMHGSNPLKTLPHLGTHQYEGEDLPDAVDWTKKGAVTRVKNQGHCGSCWSFSSTGALEGAWKIATGKLVSLSEQQLVDCSKNGNQGCSGGSMDLAFQFLETDDVCTEDSYPYTAQDGTCKESTCTAGIPKGGVVGYKDVQAEDTQALLSAVAQQPVSVAIEADQQVFQFYHSGVIKDGCGDKLDHGVLIVGYGTDNGVDYWKVKNSWGPRWGEKGYVRIKRGLPRDGECGIKNDPSYPQVKAAESSIVV